MSPVNATQFKTSATSYPFLSRGPEERTLDTAHEVNLLLRNIEKDGEQHSSRFLNSALPLRMREPSSDGTQIKSTQINRSLIKQNFPCGERYFDHGAYGVVPRYVSSQGRKLTDIIEKNPYQTYEKITPESQSIYIKIQEQARETLASEIGCDPLDLILTTGATESLNIAVKSLTKALSSEDEVLTTNHAYPTVDALANQCSDQKGFAVKKVNLEYPLPSHDEVINRIMSSVTEKTKLFICDHLSSRTASEFPIHQLIQKMNQRGITCLIDGAHAGGQVPLNLSSLGKCYYAGNCHKWMYTERGTGYLYDGYAQDKLQPNTVSTTRYKKLSDSIPRLWDQFNWRGTQSITPAFSIISAKAFVKQLHPDGYKGIIRYNQELTRYALEKLKEIPGISTPKQTNMTMITAKLPESPFVENEATLKISDELLKHGFSVPGYAWPKAPDRLIRLSLNVYNTKESIDILVNTLKNILSKEALLKKDDPRVRSLTSPEEFFEWVLPPVRAKEQQDVVSNPQQHLMSSAVSRTLSYTNGHMNPRTSEFPHAQFPNAEKHRNTCFTYSDWSKGNPESEFAKVQRNLIDFSSYKGVPAGLHDVITRDKNTSLYDYAAAISNRMDQIKPVLIQDLQFRLNDVKLLDAHTVNNVAVSQLRLATSPQASEVLSKKWTQLCAELYDDLASDEPQDQKNQKISEVLRMHKLIKDPISSVECNQEQLNLFKNLYSQAVLNTHPQDQQSKAIFISQLCSESEYLSMPTIHDLEAIKYIDHQEIPIIKANIQDLKFTEESNPGRVKEIVDETLATKSEEGCWKVTPIIVSPIPGHNEVNHTPIDGNNRIAALIAIDLIHESGLKQESVVNHIDNYFASKGLQQKLKPTIARVVADTQFVNRVQDTLLKTGSPGLSGIPAVYALETNFNVVDVSVSTHNEIVYVSPSVQYIVANSDKFISSKQQSHGRALLSEPLPLFKDENSAASVVS